MEVFEDLIKESEKVLGQLPLLSNNNYEIKTDKNPYYTYYTFGDFSFLPDYISKKLQVAFTLIGAYKYGIDAFNNPLWYIPIYEYYVNNTTAKPDLIYTIYKFMFYIKKYGWVNWCDYTKYILKVI